MIEIAGYISAIIIGLVLGLLGGGGSILTVPILVYLMGFPAYEATAYSLFIVAVTSFIGSISYLKKGLIDLRSALIFSIPSLIGVLFSRKLILPLIPEEIFSIGTIAVTRNLLIMLLFSVLILSASFSMIRKKNSTELKPVEKNNFKIIFKFFLVGMFLGFVGAGGGFLIIPSLIFFAKLDIKQAVGTSLLIISLNSFIGFAGDLFSDISFNWNLLMFFSLLSIVGIFIGTYLSKYISSSKLKPAFGYFILLMGIFIISRELNRFL